jgi:hypothetical protein
VEEVVAGGDVGTLVSRVVVVVELVEVEFVVVVVGGSSVGP